MRSAYAKGTPSPDSTILGQGECRVVNSQDLNEPHIIAAIAIIRSGGNSRCALEPVQIEPIILSIPVHNHTKLGITAQVGVIIGTPCHDPPVGRQCSAVYTSDRALHDASAKSTVAGEEIVLNGRLGPTWYFQPVAPIGPEAKLARGGGAEDIYIQKPCMDLVQRRNMRCLLARAVGRCPDAFARARVVSIPCSFRAAGRSGGLGASLLPCLCFSRAIRPKSKGRLNNQLGRAGLDERSSRSTPRVVLYLDRLLFLRFRARFRGLLGNTVC